MVRLIDLYKKAVYEGLTLEEMKVGLELVGSKMDHMQRAGGSL